FADGDNYNELFGALDNAFLVAYAIGMFISGIFGERLPLRYHLSAGMVLSGLFTALFGLVSFWNIHVLWYFIIMQVCNGLVQTTGWPSVVACVGNWFGKGKRGFIMGIWNSHTSVGNILGSLVAGVWVSSAWGFSFVVPGIVIAIMGIISFFFLVEYPEDVGCNPPMHHMASDEEDVGGVASKEKDPEAVTSHEGPLKVSGQSSGDHSNSPKEPAEEPETISFLGALRIPGVVEFSLCLLFAKLVSYTFLYWLPLYIVNVAHFGAKEAGDLSTLFDVGGILGGIFAGLVSDYTGGRATTCCVMLVVAAPMVRCHVGKKQSQGFLLLQQTAGCGARGSAPMLAGALLSKPRIDGDNYNELFGALDNAFLVAYAIGMFISGIFGERLPLRYHLSAGMVLSGLFTALFGLVSFWNIHVLWYFIIMQVCNGLVQTTGWPSVVACVGNWFGKGKRGFIMGIWNSHTSVGNILGSLVAGVWVSCAWGFSFVVPGIVIAIMGIISFFFLVEYPEDVGCNPPMHHMASDEEDVGGVASKEKDPEAVTSHEGPLKVSGQSSGDHSNSPKEPAEEPETISFLGALRIPGVVEFSLCLLFAKLVSYTFLYWLPLYIVNVAHFGAKEAGDLSTLFDVGGILGGIFAGLVSDYTGGRATTCCVMLVVAAPMLFLYNHVGQKGIGTSVVMLIVCGALVNGPYALITTAVSADLGTHECLKGNAKALSTVTAIIDGTGSVGAALGPLLAGLISPTGWNNVFYMLIAADVLACLLLVRVVVKEVRGWCGCMVRKRGYVRTAPWWPLAPRCQNTALLQLQKDVCYPLLSLLHLRVGVTLGFVSPPAQHLPPVGTKTFPPLARAVPGGF
ncbi:glucose-6-phosphate exchanger SLC37A2-like, partial [Phaenicophaeus curvirostris]|uniref:glucose-6-phosphate exchanger SLC37A2-like n=1 Tax=Phaenicophaeus curvirostris TaxID=33595 RepID=UPI0037F0CC6E